MKVIGVGLNKTGTSTLGRMLEYLGYNVKGHFLEHTYRYRDGDINTIIEDSRNYDAIYGMPWCLMYKELYKEYPNAKYILTTRINSQVYYDSHTYHQVRPVSFKRRKRTAEALLIEHGCNPLFNKDKFIEVYETHNDNIRKFFLDKQFIEICWESGDSWKELCKFLDKDIPDVPLPHRKKATYDMYEKFKRIATRNPERYLGISKERANEIIVW